MAGVWVGRFLTQHRRTREEAWVALGSTCTNMFPVNDLPVSVTQWWVTGMLGI